MWKENELSFVNEEFIDAAVLPSFVNLTEAGRMDVLPPRRLCSQALSTVWV